MSATGIRLLFRADGNSQTGLGHLYRTFALIEMYSGKYECLLRTKASTSSAVIPKRYNWRILPELLRLEEAQWLAAEYSPSVYRLIADGYDFDQQYQESVKKAGFYLLYIDDLLRAGYVADVIVNHSLGVKASDYNISSFTRFALGPHYSLLRPEFLDLAIAAPRERKKEKAFVCFGGSDPGNLTDIAVRALLQHTGIRQVFVVVGSGFPNERADAIGRLSDNVVLKKNLDAVSLVRTMEESDFAISSASTVLYELCAAKVPTMAGYYVQNQQKLYTGFLQKGAIFGCGDLSRATVADFITLLKSFLNENGWTNYQMSQHRLFDGKVRQRFIALVEKITYRLAELDDMELIFDWSSDRVVRANSYNSEPITAEKHKAWFEGKIKDANVRMYIAEVEGVPAGFVRYETAAQTAVVGVIVDHKFRGRDLSAQFLKDTARLFFSEYKVPVLAYIKTANTVSRKAFEKAGYLFRSEELVNGAPSYIYVLTHDNAE